MSRDPRIAYSPVRNVHGWPPTLSTTGRPNKPRPIVYAPLSEVLLDEGDTDAHFYQYGDPGPDHPYRLNSDAVKLLPDGVRMELLVLDVDCPKKRSDKTSDPAWLEEESPKIEKLLETHPDLIVALSRGGYRLIGLLPEPMALKSASDADDWTDLYLLVAAEVYRLSGITADPKCRDWTHLQRAPRAMRIVHLGDASVVEREPGIIAGDPHSVGCWRLEAVDFEQARLAKVELQKGDTKGWAETRSREESRQRQAAAKETYYPADAGPTGDYAHIVDPVRKAVGLIPEGGGRHTLYMALASVLLDRGVAPEALEDVIGRISVAAGVDGPRETEDRVKAARTTVQRAGANQSRAGIGVLQEHYPIVASAVDFCLPRQETNAEKVAKSFFGTKAEMVPAGVTAAITAPALDTASDYEVALIALHHCRQDEVEVVHTRDDFWWYNPENGIWHPIGSKPIEDQVHDLDGAPFGQKGTYKANDGRVRGAVRRAATEVQAPRFFEEAPQGIAFQNGFLNVGRDGSAVFLSPSPDHRVAVALPMVYDPEARAPRWERFFSEVFAGQIDATQRAAFLQEFVGACLVGAATSFQKCLLLVGEGDNGKSVFLKVVSAMFPREATAAIAPQQFSQPYFVAQLAGIRLNVVAEAPNTDVTNSETFKAVVAGDEVTGRHPTGRPFKYRPTAGNMFSANALMGTTDQSHGYWRRFVPVSFDRRFTDADKEVDLDKKIIEGELPGVVNWALEGARRALARGRYATPPSVSTLLGEWRANSDQVALFVEECCEKTVDGARTLGSSLYQTFREWALRNGHKPMANNKFADRLKSLGHSSAHTKSGNAWDLQVKKSERGSFLSSIPGGRTA